MAPTRFCFYFVSSSLLLLSLWVFASASSTDPSMLSLDYYKSLCPGVLDIVRREMECAVISDPRNAALIVRLHFHDCFVQVGLHKASSFHKNISMMFMNILI